jgi:hypothetical protein
MSASPLRLLSGLVRPAADPPHAELCAPVEPMRWSAWAAALWLMQS